mgnify:CR=1 FL=1
MEKELFKNKEPLARLQMLQDNCAAIEKITYPHQFSEEEMEARKTSLANLDIEMSELEAEKKAVQDRIKEQRGKLIEDIKRKYEDVTDECYKFLDRETRTACYYNGNGDLVRERPMEAQEMQKTIQEDLAATGTDY